MKDYFSSINTQIPIICEDTQKIEQILLSHEVNPSSYGFKDLARAVQIYDPVTMSITLENGLYDIIAKETGRTKNAIEVSIRKVKNATFGIYQTNEGYICFLQEIYRGNLKNK